eukprot:m.206743 g.206743  ORF g.206743 m.206743 type:complete len:80 (+) comp23453_c0_seq1:52-291(+)
MAAAVRAGVDYAVTSVGFSIRNRVLLAVVLQCAPFILLIKVSPCTCLPEWLRGILSVDLPTCLGLTINNTTLGPPMHDD